jgi:glycosyltransferase involved in cell wall biosynthesis
VVLARRMIGLSRAGTGEKSNRRTKGGMPYLKVETYSLWGLPVVAASAGGHLETLGAVTGARMFTPGDADEAAALLCGLAADPLERREYGRSLREHQRNFLALAGHATAVGDAYLIAREEKATTIQNRRQRGRAGRARK